LASLTTIGGKMLQPNGYSLQLAYYGTLRDGIGLSKLRGMLSMYCIISSLLYCKNIKISYNYKSVALFLKHKCETVHIQINNPWAPIAYVKTPK